jgi:hypothetical protein
MMVFDITQWGIGQNLIHEMSHVIDNKLMDMGLIDELNEQWSECNPEGFEYYDSYMGYEGDWTYTAYSDEYYEDMDAEKIYFYDDYAKTYPGEDRARIMENFYDWDWVESYYNSSHFQAKIGIYLDFLEAHFDTCRDGNYKWRDMYERLIKEGI